MAAWERLDLTSLVLKMEEEGHESKDVSALWKLGKADHPPELPTGRQACQHLDFNPVRHIPDFWPLEL